MLVTDLFFELKNHKIKLVYKDRALSLKGLGKIKLEKELNKIEYSFLKKDKTYSFETDLEINDTPIKINLINYDKGKNLNSKLKIDSFLGKEARFLE